jgi:dTDP-4-dehydrorhamnose 3,5-epimerase-like enzyme
MDNLTSFKSFKDERGYLLPISFSVLDFVPKRVFVVNGVPPGCVRGNHSHYKTKQYLICTSGAVNVILDNGTSIETKLLSEGDAILIPELIWDSQEFLAEGSSIMVLCSTEYDINDYILTYDEFINEIRKI